MRSERQSLSIFIILCVLTGVQGFLYAYSVSPDLYNILYSLQVSYGGSVLEVLDANLYGGGNNSTAILTTRTGYIVFQADLNGLNKINVSTNIDGISEETSPDIAWSGTGYAGSYTTSNGYTIEIAERDYFSGVTPDPDPIPSDVTTEGILISVGIGILLWQVFMRSYHERSVMW